MAFEYSIRKDMKELFCRKGDEKELTDEEKAIGIINTCFKHGVKLSIEDLDGVDDLVCDFSEVKVDGFYTFGEAETAMLHSEKVIKNNKFVWERVRIYNAVVKVIEIVKQNNIEDKYLNALINELDEQLNKNSWKDK